MKFKKIIWTMRAILYNFKLKRVGKMSYIGKPIGVVNGKNIEIKDKVRIFPNSRMETHENGRITIGDNVSIAQNFHCTSKTGNLCIGDGTVVAANVFVTNIDHEYSDPYRSISEQGLIFKDTQIGKNCFIGIGAGIQAGTVLGENCIVGANSIVRGVYPDHCVIVGSPGRIVKRYCRETDTWRKISE